MIDLMMFLPIVFSFLVCFCNFVYYIHMGIELRKRAFLSRHCRVISNPKCNGCLVDRAISRRASWSANCKTFVVCCLLYWTGGTDFSWNEAPPGLPDPCNQHDLKTPTDCFRSQVFDRKRIFFGAKYLIEIVFFPKHSTSQNRMDVLTLWAASWTTYSICWYAWYRRRIFFS